MTLATRRIFSLLAVALFPLTFLATAGSATAAPTDPSDHTVTSAARYCDGYQQIYANRARNNIQEMLRDLGPDSPYGEYGQRLPVRPGVEDGTEIDPDNPQVDCKPLVDWDLTLGEGYAKPPNTDPLDPSLSVVTGVYDPPIRTESSVPLLDTDGDPVPGQSVAGATTITLTQAQLERANSGQNLWLQGGTVAQPLNGQGEQYGFGSLRCSTDALNGDNVEFLAFPSGAKHTFCYAYYVSPPPKSGRIIIEKRLTEGSKDSATFGFTGTVSFEADGSFSLGVVDGGPARVEFVRGAVAVPWTATEDAKDGFSLADLTCTSAQAENPDDDPATEPSRFVISGRSAAILLGAGDVATSPARTSRSRTCWWTRSPRAVSVVRSYLLSRTVTTARSPRGQRRPPARGRPSRR